MRACARLLIRHARPRAGHPRLHDIAAGKTWMAGNKSGHDAARQSGHDASRQSGHDAGCVARRPFPIFLIHFSNSPSSVQASSPVFFAGAPGRPVSFSSLLTPLGIRGGWRARWRNHCSLLPHSLSRARAPPGAPSRRSPYGTGPRFSLAASIFWKRPCVSQLLAGGSYWPPGGAPAPPGCVLCGKHARGRRIRSHPHDAS